MPHDDLQKLEEANRKLHKQLMELEDINYNLTDLLARIGWIIKNGRQCGKSSALDRIHMRRLMIYVEKMVRFYARNT